MLTSRVGDGGDYKGHCGDREGSCRWAQININRWLKNGDLGVKCGEISRVTATCSRGEVMWTSVSPDNNLPELRTNFRSCAKQHSTNVCAASHCVRGPIHLSEDTWRYRVRDNAHHPTPSVRPYKVCTARSNNNIHNRETPQNLFFRFCAQRGTEGEERRKK